MHHSFLSKALNQARQGRGLCSPNPSVGAVAVCNGMIIAQGWHQGAGCAHAEINVLQQFPAHTAGVTLYVTLEPCNHWGKTPPCTDAIIAHGIEKVVYGYKDPNPLVAGNNTTEKLKANHIEVEYSPMPEIDAYYESYTYWVLRGKPWVTVKLAQSLDGKIAGNNGKRIQISNEFCQRFTHQLRQNCDIILSTAQTVNNDDPMFNVRIDGYNTARALAILDSRSSLNPEAQALHLARDVLIYRDKPLDAVIQDLGNLGYHEVLVEAGGRLFHALHQQKLVNRTYLYIAPKVLGADALSAHAEANDYLKGDCVTWIPAEDNIIARFDWEKN